MTARHSKAAICAAGKGLSRNKAASIWSFDNHYIKNGKDRTIAETGHVLKGDIGQAVQHPQDHKERLAKENILAFTRPLQPPQFHVGETVENIRIILLAGQVHDAPQQHFPGFDLRNIDYLMEQMQKFLQDELPIERRKLTDPGKDVLRSELEPLYW